MLNSPAAGLCDFGKIHEIINCIFGILQMGEILFLKSRCPRWSPACFFYLMEQDKSAEESGKPTVVISHHVPTLMLTNQLGYVHRYEYKSFDGGKMLEL